MIPANRRVHPFGAAKNRWRWWQRGQITIVSANGSTISVVASPHVKEGTAYLLRGRP